MIEIKVGGLYHVSELRMAEYTSAGIEKLEHQKEAGLREAIKYKRGNENLLVAKSLGFLRVIARFDSQKMKTAEIYRRRK